MTEKDKKIKELEYMIERYKNVVKDLAYVNIQLQKQLNLTDVSKRYDANKYTPPFRVGRKQGKAVLDGKGIEVVFFNNSEEQASKYCDYLNGC